MCGAGQRLLRPFGPGKPVFVLGECKPGFPQRQNACAVGFTMRARSASSAQSWALRRNRSAIEYGCATCNDMSTSGV